ncbi:hypothetical protein BC943DRAFT_330360 [Umbelopsis sp. AD052]|nr:hypothetical protein BC943DRAFT_330360 [Umbelopsis sp. AD052]
MKILLFIFFLVGAASAWDINRSSPNCTGIVAPGLINTQTGVIYGRDRSTCIAKHCKCHVIASGSIIPPKISKIQCTGEDGCQYAGYRPMRRIASPGCQAAVLAEKDCI